jgi:hypothetical protein
VCHLYIIREDNVLALHEILYETKKREETLVVLKLLAEMFEN